MNFDDYETLPTNNVTTHMTAGAIAGIMEHCVMYPLDSVKTRMQSLYTSSAAREGVSETFLRMVRHEGLLRPVRGMSAVVVGAGPAHALYFSCYEYIKETAIQKTTSSTNHTLICGAAGCIATLLHDGIMNPAEVAKQRLQMYNSPYKSVMECIRKIYKTEGIKAFYRSYTTQLTMNIPFQSIHFMSYELCQSITNRERVYNPSAHMISGAIAGAVAAAVTTPLDVCKTLLNTQENKTKVKGLTEAIKTVYRLRGPSGYFRGLQARVLYQMPSTAICWSTYEFFKYLLGTVRLDDSNIRLVVPQTHVFAENVETPTTAPTTRITESEKLALKPRELPSMSGTGLYGAISFNTIHSSNDSSPGCTGMNKGSTFNAHIISTHR